MFKHLHTLSAVMARSSIVNFDKGCTGPHSVQALHFGPASDHRLTGWQKGCIHTGADSTFVHTTSKQHFVSALLSP